MERQIVLKENIVEALKKTGVSKGQTIMVHTSDIEKYITEEILKKVLTTFFDGCIITTMKAMASLR